MPPVPMNLLLRVNHPKRFSVDTVVPRQGEGGRGWRQTTNWTTAESTKSVPGSNGKPEYSSPLRFPRTTDDGDLYLYVTRISISFG
ncbi:hypothetical protein TNCT_398251 [Trichonephila clavata]|uniref:Uncharacterized protein n=2 Tax=Trichonephila clavata TaxID=2740835 RepID=A0A8X6KDT9_TRICU|nr:hypothetical protein TNCT_398251 [Trichonephila clavata]